MSQKQICSMVFKPNKILKEHLNNVNMSSIVKKTFKNTKTNEELNSVKELSQKTIQQVFKMNKLNLIFFYIWLGILLVGLAALISIAILIDKQALWAIIPLFFWPMPFLYTGGARTVGGGLSGYSSFKSGIVGKNFPSKNYKPLKEFLLDIKSNLSDDPSFFPLMIQQLYFKDEEAAKKLKAPQKFKILPQDPNSPIYADTVANRKRPFIEFPNFIIKYVDYCQSKSN